jgi:hypothetical protein
VASGAIVGTLWLEDINAQGLRARQKFCPALYSDGVYEGNVTDR